MKDVTALRFWCHKVIPLVYDESLSYYEVLCKVAKKLNEVIESVNEQNETIENFISQDLTSEIEEIVSEELEGYVTSSELTTVLNSYVTNTALATELDDYATKAYVDNAIGVAMASSY